MAKNHLQIFYGAYLDGINNEIPQSDIMLSQTDSISRSMEPGKPGMPSAETYTFNLAGRDPEGNRKYDFSWFQNASRDDGTYEIEIFFEVKINGDTRFIGLYDDVSYSERDQMVSVTIRDLTKIFKEDQRSLLKTFDFGDEVEVQQTSDSVLGGTNGINDVYTAADIKDTEIKHECIRFFVEKDIFYGGDSTGPNAYPDPEAYVEFGTEYAIHAGISGRPSEWDIDYSDLRQDSGNDQWDYISPHARIRNTFVQIGEITLFTKIRESVIVGVDKSGFQPEIGAKFAAYLIIDVWHNVYDADDSKDGIQPVATKNGLTYLRGHYFADTDDRSKRFTPAGNEVDEGSKVSLSIHDYNMGYDEIAVDQNDLPSRENFIFGASYSQKANFIRLTATDYSYFDVIKKTISIFNSEVTRRFTQSSFAGSIKVKNAAPGSSDAKATFQITINSPPQQAEQIYFLMEKTGRSDTAFADATFSAQKVADDLFTAMKGSSIEDDWDLAQNGKTINGTAKQVGTKYNNRSYGIFKRKPTKQTGDKTYQEITDYEYTGLETTADYDDASPTSGGSTSPQSGLRIYFGFPNAGEYVDTAQLNGGESPDSIAQKITDAINNDATISADFTATRAVDTVNIDSSLQEPEVLIVDPQSTGMLESDFDIEDISGQYEVFDISKLRDNFRRAFWADPVFFGWIDRKFVNILVGLAWQTVAYLYSQSDGKLAIQSRDWYETFPTSYDPDTYPVTTLKDADIEPIKGDDYENGFQTYSVEFPVDILEINNVKADETGTMYVDESGVRKQPSYRNETLQTDNYRIFDLGVPDTSESDDLPIFRQSPRSDEWPHNVGLKKFLPTPAIQAIIFARNFNYPVLRKKYRTSLLKYPDLDVGDYVVTEDQVIWLIESISIDPESFRLELGLEFKKDLFKAFESFKEAAVVQEKFEVFKEGVYNFKEPVYAAENYRERQTVKAFKEPVYVAEKTDKQLTQSGPSESVYANESFEVFKNPPESAFALSFDGTDDYVSIPSPYSNLSNILDRFTFECWIKTTDTSIQTLIGCFNNNDSQGMQININENDSASNQTDEVRFYVRATGGNYLGATATLTGLTNGNWHHVAFVRDGDNSVKIYLDGVSKSVSVYNGGNPTSFADWEFDVPLFARNVRGAVDQYFNGFSDEIRLWDGVRTQSEIQDNYFKILDPANNANLVNYWRFEDDSDISTALDETSNNNDGTINGATYNSDTPFDYDLS